MRWSRDVRPRGRLKAITPLEGYSGARQENAISGNIKRLLESQGP
jgi:hypothetical protein